MRVLLAEDDLKLGKLIQYMLEQNQLATEWVKDGEQAYDYASYDEYDVVILDWMMPKMSGVEVCKKLRANGYQKAIMLLTARDAVEDRVAGLDAGADDYLVKPFHLEELEARIRSLTLRQFTQNDVVLTCGEVTFDTKARTAAAAGRELALTRKETGILEYLMLHRGRPVSQEELIDHVWDNSVDNFSNSIRVHISALRKKLRTALGYDPIRNRIGEGYQIEEGKA